MANEVQTYKIGMLGARPQHLATTFGEDTNLVIRGQRVPSLTFQNRVFSIYADGEEHRLTKKIDGEEVPLPAIPVIILGYQEARIRVFYKGSFDASNVKQPDCWSSDGLKPDDAVAEKQHSVCASCPQSAKGSKVTDNNKTVTACQQRRIVAVVPAKGLTKFPALRLSLPITSEYDGRSPHNDREGKFAFSNFIDFARQNGAKMSYDLITRISFDMTQGVTYPKLLFSAMDWVSDEDAKEVRRLLDDGSVDLVLGQSEGAQQGAVADAQNTDPEKKKTRGRPKADASAPKTTETAPKEDPKVAESAKLAAEQAQRKVEAQKKAAAAKAAAEEAARLAAEAEAEANGDASGLGDDDAGTQTASDMGEVDPRNPPDGAGLAADQEVNDIINNWGDD